jgi:hypothetical protein
MGYFYRGRRLLGLVLLCLGIGILLVLILPFWGWLALGGAGLIIMGWFLFRR